MDGNKLKLPVGIENFKEIRTEGFYYIDKTTLIADLLHSWGKVNLFTRPRRFGKSEIEKVWYKALLNVDDKGNFEVSDEVLMNGLLTLSGLLQKHYGSKVIILIDEYDVPLAKAIIFCCADRMFAYCKREYIYGDE